MIKRFVAEIKQGQVTYANQGYVNHHLSKFKDGKVVVSVETPKNYRSINQNRLYRVYLNFLEQQFGTSADRWHMYFKAKFLPKIGVDIFGDQVLMSGTTTRLSKGEFIEYLERIQHFAAKKGVNLPDYQDPNIVSLINEM